MHAFILQAIRMERVLGISKGAETYSGQGRGESRERGIQGAGGELRAAGANRGQQVRIAGSGGKLCKKGILPCFLYKFFVNISKT